MKNRLYSLIDATTIGLMLNIGCASRECTKNLEAKISNLNSTVSTLEEKNRRGEHSFGRGIVEWARGDLICTKIDGKEETYHVGVYSELDEKDTYQPKSIILLPTEEYSIKLPVPTTAPTQQPRTPIFLDYKELMKDLSSTTNQAILQKLSEYYNK